MTLPLRVLGDRILVQPDTDRNAPELLTSGIHVAKTLTAAVIGEDTTTSVQRGTVVAVGTPTHPLKHEAEDYAEKLEAVSWTDGAYFSGHDPMMRECANTLRLLVCRKPAVTIGDDVLFNHDAGQLITLASQSYIILHEHELLAVVEPEQELCQTI